MRKCFALGIGIAACAVTSASGQAVTGFTGGSLFDLYYGGSTGDAVGWRFEVTEPIRVTHLGVYNNDTSGMLDADHEVGLWDSSETLLADTIVTPSSPLTGNWRYEPVTAVELVPGTVYTVGAVYTSDGDQYLSGPTSVDTAPEVTLLNGVYPLAASLGLTYPALDTPNNGRFGPNFLFSTDGECYADCDESGDLDFFDFLCFQNAFAAGDPYADCDDSGDLDFFDFLCFQNEFAAGCP